MAQGVEIYPPPLLENPSLSFLVGFGFIKWMGVGSTCPEAQGERGEGRNGVEGGVVRGKGTYCFAHVSSDTPTPVKGFFS